MPIRIDRDNLDMRGNLRLQLPPTDLIPVKALRDAVERYESAHRASNVAAQQVVQVGKERTAAEDADRKLYADAIEAGKSDPGCPNVDAHEQKLADASRYADAQAEVRARAQAALLKAFEEHGDELEAKITETLDEARADLLAAVDALEAKKNALAIAKSLDAWASGRSRRFNPTPSGGKVRVGSHDIAVDALIDALRTYVEPPAPRPVLVMQGPLRATG